MSCRADRARVDDLIDLAAALPRQRCWESAAQAVVQTIGSGNLACCLIAVEGDSARGLAISIGSQSGAGLDPRTAERLLEYVVPIDGLGFLREVVRRRCSYAGTSGAIGALMAMPSLERTEGAELARLRDRAVVAAPVETRDGVVGVLMAWGDGCVPESIRLVEGAAGLLSLVRDRVAAARPDGTVRPPSTLVEPSALQALEGILISGRLRAALQPIVRLHDGTIMGWEALCRFEPVAPLDTPDDLFAAAAAAGREAELETICLRAGLSQGRNAEPAPLFVNIGMGVLLSEGLAEQLDALLAEARLPASRVVLELSERHPVSDIAKLQRVTTDLRTGGYRIAVDDAGSGHASMRVVAEIRPDFIKIDRSLVRDVATDNARRALVVSLLSFGGHLGSRVIAEGVESEVERRALTDLGVQYGQGFHLGMPVMQAPPVQARDVVAVDPTWFGEQHVVGFDASTLDQETSIRIDTPEVVRAAAKGRRSLPQALSNAARALQSEHDRAGILRVIAEQLVLVVPVGEIAIYAADYETHRFVPVLATGPDATEILADAFSLDSGLTGWAFASGVPHNIRDTSRHPRSRQIPGTPVVEESMLLLPMVAGDRRLGIINCYRAGAGQFSAADLKAAALFAHMAAAAWRNAELYGELMDAAMTDPLTSLHNTRWLHEVGARDLARSVRLGSPHAVLLIDLDHFKQVNDSCGHSAGDTVLRRVSRALCALSRRTDSVVRLGGEEFLVLLPDTGAVGATVHAEQVREAIRRNPLPDRCTLDTLTASIGVAAYPECGSTIDLLIRAADNALYEAKRGGRDRVTVAQRCAAPESMPRRGVAPPEWMRSSAS